MDELKTAFEQLNIPFVYSHFQKPVAPPYIAYIGAGQEDFGADNTWYHRRNRYQLEYYFKVKNEATEEQIEQILLSHGYNYTKSEDVFNESENVFLIYYDI